MDLRQQCGCLGAVSREHCCSGVVSPSRVTALPEFGGTEEEQERYQSEPAIFTPRFEPRDLCIFGRSFSLPYIGTCANALCAVMSLVVGAFASKRWTRAVR